MKILFWLEPHYDLIRPGIMSQWLNWYESIASVLKSAVEDFDYQIVCLDYFTYIDSKSNSNGRLVRLSPADLHANWKLEGCAFIELEHDRVPHEVCENISTILSQKMGGGEPEIVFMLNQQPWLRRFFKNSLFVNIELSWTSRAPYPITWQLDIAGAGKGRLLADYKYQILDSCRFSSDQCLTDNVIKTAKSYLVNKDAEFFVSSLRDKFSTVKLLPIGVFDRYDGKTSIFSILDKYLSEEEFTTAVILTQYPEWKSVTIEQLSYLSNKYHNFFDGDCIGSQFLLPIVDSVIGDFSTVGTQALFFDTEVFSIQDKLLNFPIKSPLCNPLVDILSSFNLNQRKSVLEWLLCNYTIPNRCLFNGVWLSGFLRRAVEAVRVQKPWIAYSDPFATSIDWDKTNWRDISRSEFQHTEVRLYFSEFIGGDIKWFSEPRTCSENYPISGQRQIIHLPMLPDFNPVVGIRLDPSNCLMAFNLHGLRIFDGQDHELWRWDGDREIFQRKSGVVFNIRNDGLLLLILDNDPHFEISVPDYVLDCLTNASTFIIEFTPMLIQDVIEELLIPDNKDLVQKNYHLNTMARDLHCPNIDKNLLSLNLSSSLELLSKQIKNTLDIHNKKIIDQTIKINLLNDELLRAEAQLDLLKELIFIDSSRDWL